MPVVGILDYGMGNLRSVEKGFHKAGVSAEVFADPLETKSYSGLVLPGVGAFGDAMKNLRELGMLEPLYDHLEKGGYLLGICLGMQLLFEYSEEHGRHSGMGLIPGRVVRLPGIVKIPHIGWNVVDTPDRVPLFEGIPTGSRFYFVHSYRCEPTENDWTAGTTPYGVEFSSAVGRYRIWGVQFHPEKSSMLGLRVLGNYGSMVREGSID